MCLPALSTGGDDEVIPCDRLGPASITLGRVTSFRHCDSFESLLVVQPSQHLLRPAYFVTGGDSMAVRSHFTPIRRRIRKAGSQARVRPALVVVRHHSLNTRRR